MNTQRQTTIKKIIVFSVCSFVTGFLFVPIKDLCSKIDIIEVIHGFAQGYNDLSKMNTPKYGFANWISPKGNLYIGEWENQLDEKFCSRGLDTRSEKNGWANRTHQQMYAKRLYFQICLSGQE